MGPTQTKPSIPADRTERRDRAERPPQDDRTGSTSLSRVIVGVTALSLLAYLAASEGLHNFLAFVRAVAERLLGGGLGA